MGRDPSSKTLGFKGEGARKETGSEKNEEMEGEGQGKKKKKEKALPFALLPSPSPPPSFSSFFSLSFSFQPPSPLKPWVSEDGRDSLDQTSGNSGTKLNLMEQNVSGN